MYLFIKNWIYENFDVVLILIFSFLYKLEYQSHISAYGI